MCLIPSYVVNSLNEDVGLFAEKSLLSVTFWNCLYNGDKNLKHPNVGDLWRLVTTKNTPRSLVVYWSLLHPQFDQRNIQLWFEKLYQKKHFGLRTTSDITKQLLY